MKRLNINLTDAEHTRFKLACVKQGHDMTAVLKELMKQYVKSQKVKKKRH